MLLARYFEREKLLSSGLKFILPQDISTPAFLARVSLITFFTAALFTNDASCVMLTPAVLIHWVNHKRDPDELPVLLLTIASSANIGSSATVFGNPQMALIAAKTDSPLYAESRLDLRTCLLYLGLPALLCGLCNVIGLTLYHVILKKLHRNSLKEQTFSTIFTLKNDHQNYISEASGSRLFQILLILVLCVVVALLFTSTSTTKFDIGWYY
jgi:Na+/H+ antiporter NhaD/arsenite permease-like protein